MNEVRRRNSQDRKARKISEEGSSSRGTGKAGRRKENISTMRSGVCKRPREENE